MFFDERRDLPMKKATIVKEILDSFDPRPLSTDQRIREFFVDTTEARGDDAAGKLRFLLENVKRDDQKFLFMGHHGCGKSTELYNVAESLKDEYFVIQYSIREYTDILGVTYIDILFSLLRNIVRAAIDNNIDINTRVVDSIFRYWNAEKVMTFTDEEEITFQGETAVGASLLSILSAKLKLLLQSSSKIKTEVSDKIEPTVPQLIDEINAFLADFKNKLPEKKLLIIIDDMDKLGIPEAESIFIDHVRQITSLNANIVYTFPIYLFYSPKYRYIINEFDETLILSMIKVKTRDGNNYELGIETIKNIIYRRANSNLFEPGAIDFVVEKCGGSIRTAFTIIREAALNAELSYRRAHMSDDSQKMISNDDMLFAYRSYKSGLEKVVRTDHLPLLKEVAKNKRPLLDKENILVMELLVSLIVIEYNGERWCDLNPAIRDYLMEQNVI